MATFGEMLYQARKDAGYTLSDVARETIIRLKILENMEAGDIDGLPAPGYVRGFINSYTHFLGLDPQPFLTQFDKESGISTSEGNHDRPIHTNEVVPSSHQQHAINWRVALVICGGIALIGFIVWLAATLIFKKPDVIPTPVVPKSTESAQTTSVNTTDTASSTNKPFALRVGVKSGVATQVKIVVDGAQAYNGTLTNGNKKVYDVVGNAVITAAEPGKLLVYLDGKTYKMPTTANAEVTLTSNSK
ncbi:MAG: helix-turn-helix domain-containing protein [Coriobacteriia bacterium]|nr:helix-turn-helix domain-containing protein [Coriobacteriia bacterium]